MDLSRRAVLGGIAGSALVRPGPAVAADPSAASGPSVAELAAERGLVFGSWVRGSSLRSDPAFAALVKRECRLIVSGPETQWSAVSATPGAHNFAATDSIVEFAGRNVIGFRGHALVWHGQAPAWFRSLPTRADAELRLREHVVRMCAHFAGRVHSWDVVNEAIRPTDGRPDKLRNTVFLEKIGPEYIEIAFAAARQADPKALLVLNEFFLELDRKEDGERRRKILDVIDDFKRRNVPIDAIGIQSHLATGDMREFNERVFSAFLRDVADRGLKILISELDVVDRSAPGDVAARDKEVAETYRRYLSVALDNRAVAGVVIWGLSDRDSWIVRGDDPKFRRTDGLTPRPLPFDKDFRPKPAYAAIAEALAAAPRR